MKGSWKLKVAIQLVLAHVPGGESVNNVLQRLNGSFSDAAYGSRVSGLTKFLSEHLDVNEKSVVEVGTGWNAIQALMLYLFGARVIYSYDHVRHVRFDLAMRVVQQMHAQSRGIAATSGIDSATLDQRIERLLDATDLQTLLDRANIKYIAPGDAAKTGLPDHSIDVFYSYAVLEHVSEATIAALTEEARRVLVPGGIAFHNIGLHDHYVSVDSSITKVNFLKYPEWMWNLFVQNKISYHNRLREPAFLQIFDAHGATIKKKESFFDPEDVETVKSMNVDSRFAGLTPEELAINRTIVTLSFDPS